MAGSRLPLGASGPSNHLLLDGVCADPDRQRQPHEMDNLPALSGTLRPKQTETGTAVAGQ
ncbi:MAG: hypothetical protein WA947_00455 [Phormidesmis sp.]